MFPSIRKRAFELLVPRAFFSSPPWTPTMTCIWVPRSSNPLRRNSQVRRFRFSSVFLWSHKTRADCAGNPHRDHSPCGFGGGGDSWPKWGDFDLGSQNAGSAARLHDEKQGWFPWSKKPPSSPCWFLTACLVFCKNDSRRRICNNLCVHVYCLCPRFLTAR